MKKPDMRYHSTVNNFEDNRHILIRHLQLSYDLLLACCCPYVSCKFFTVIFTCAETIFQVFDGAKMEQLVDKQIMYVSYDLSLTCCLVIHMNHYKQFFLVNLPNIRTILRQNKMLRGTSVFTIVCISVGLMDVGNSKYL